MAGTEPSRERTKYLKRKQTILKKIWELSTFCDVEVHVKFVHALETIIIDSTDDVHWPPEDEMEETEDRPINRYDLESLGQYLQDKEAEAFSVEQDEIQLPEPPRLRRLW